MKPLRTGISLLVLLCAVGSPLSALRYKFDYDMISDIRKTYALLYKFRLFYHAHASAYFNASRTGSGRYAYRFAGLPDSGYRIRTHRRGSKLSVVTAAYTFASAKAAYPRRIASFRAEAPFYSKMIEIIARRPFRILPTSGNSIRFNRNVDGTYDGYGFSLQMVKPADMSPYDDSFNIYKLMVEMIKMISHQALPGRTLASLPASATKTWQSPWINYGRLIAGMSLLADYKGRKYFSYSQPHSFRMTYRALSRRNGRVTVMGVGYPGVEIGMGMRIRKVTRYIIYRESDGLLIRDKFNMSALNSDNLGWTFRGDLRLL